MQDLDRSSPRQNPAYSWQRAFLNCDIDYGLEPKLHDREVLVLPDMFTNIEGDVLPHPMIVNQIFDPLFAIVFADPNTALVLFKT